MLAFVRSQAGACSLIRRSACTSALPGTKIVSLNCTLANVVTSNSDLASASISKLPRIEQEAVGEAVGKVRSKLTWSDAADARHTSADAQSGNICFRIVGFQRKLCGCKTNHGRLVLSEGRQTERAWKGCYSEFDVSHALTLKIPPLDLGDAFQMRT